MSDQSVRPEECPPGKHYTGIVRTGSGTHARILQRYDKYSESPWVYYKEECSTPLFVADDDVSELLELHPFVNDHLRDTQKALDQARDELDQAERVIEALKKGLVPVSERMTEQRVRELAREEINRTSWQLHGLNITHKEQQ